VCGRAGRGGGGRAHVRGRAVLWQRGAGGRGGRSPPSCSPTAWHDGGNGPSTSRLGSQRPEQTVAGVGTGRWWGKTIVCCHLWERRPFWTSASLAAFVCRAALAVGTASFLDLCFSGSFCLPRSVGSYSLSVSICRPVSGATLLPHSGSSLPLTALFSRRRVDCCPPRYSLESCLVSPAALRVHVSHAVGQRGHMRNTAAGMAACVFLVSREGLSLFLLYGSTPPRCRVDGSDGRPPLPLLLCQSRGV